MSIWGALAGGFAGTLVLTTVLRAASEMRLTRMDLPFLLGTAVTSDRRQAREGHRLNRTLRLWDRSLSSITSMRGSSGTVAGGLELSSDWRTECSRVLPS